MKQTIQRICTILMLLTLITIMVSIALMENHFAQFDIMEVHETAGTLFFILAFVHIALYWKSVKRMVTLKK